MPLAREDAGVVGNVEGQDSPQFVHADDWLAVDIRCSEAKLRNQKRFVALTTSQRSGVTRQGVIWFSMFRRHGERSPSSFRISRSRSSASTHRAPVPRNTLIRGVSWLSTRRSGRGMGNFLRSTASIAPICGHTPHPG